MWALPLMRSWTLSTSCGPRPFSPILPPQRRTGRRAGRRRPRLRMATSPERDAPGTAGGTPALRQSSEASRCRSAAIMAAWPCSAGPWPGAMRGRRQAAEQQWVTEAPMYLNSHSRVTHYAGPHPWCVNAVRQDVAYPWGKSIVCCIMGGRQGTCCGKP